MYICKICGFDGLEQPQYYEDDAPSFVSCPCCGFESGFDDDDLGYTFVTYREKWLLKGAKWTHLPEPESGWDLKRQLENIGINLNK